MPTLNWIDFFLAAGLIQGLLLAFVLPRHTAAQKATHILLSWLLAAASLTILLFINSRIPSDRPPQLHILMDTLAFLYGPLLYLYLRKLLFPAAPSPTHTWPHFVPALLHFGYFLAAFRYSSSEFIERIVLGAFRTEWVYILAVLLGVLWSYWVASVRLVQHFRKQEKQVISYRQNIWYVSIFLVATAITYVIGTLFSLDFFAGIRMFSFTHTNLGWVMIPFLIYFISYYAIRKPEGMYVVYQAEAPPVTDTLPIDTASSEPVPPPHIAMLTTDEKKGRDRMTPDQVQQYVGRLENHMQREKPYLEPTLSLQELSEQLGLQSTKLSWLINEHYQCNFYDYINTYRVEAFLAQIQKGVHQKQTLLSLAFEAGFNSKTTFNKAFKKVTQYTPSDYVQRLNEAKSVA